MTPSKTADRQIIAASRNLIVEYSTLLDLVKNELLAETEEESFDGKDAFEIARKTIRKEARKEAFRDFINRIKTYGNQQLS